MSDNGNVPDLTVHADPSKAFFVDMLTRDIGLTDCILDLVDNSVHSMIVNHNLDIMEELLKGRIRQKEERATIDIKFSGSKFSIEDTCDGISVADAKERVF